MDRNSFRALAKEFSAIPVYRVMMADTVTPVSLFLKMRDQARYPFLLESVEGGEQLARYSFLGRNPYKVLTFSEGRVKLATWRHVTATHGKSTEPIHPEHKLALRGEGDHQIIHPKQELATQDESSTEPVHPEPIAPEIEDLGTSYFEALQQLLQTCREPHIPDMPRLTGGAVGYSSYDTIRQVEHLPDTPHDELKLPDAVWAFYDEIYAFDHVKHRVILIKTVFTDGAEGQEDVGLKNAQQTIDERYEQALLALDRMEQVFKTPTPRTQGYRKTTGELQSNTSRQQFHDMVSRARDYIYEGDIFQVVLSQRFTSSFEGDRFMLYRALRMVNPSPYLFYLDYDSYALVGSSPEVLVQVQDGTARVLPIAGTRPRGNTAQEDLTFEQSLMADPKELAEHIMLVDLGRNDLSRVCVPKSVEVTRDRTIERYSHVMHIVSEVCGSLSATCSAVDALKYCFPAGTVSGAPKVRAMEIIDEMEPTRRGPYAGAVGYFDFSGNMDTCIAIRTMVVSGNSIHIQAGAGIVADSDPELEYNETVNKAKALVEALDVALKLD